jgi:hypothetical protein
LKPLLILVLIVFFPTQQQVEREEPDLQVVKFSWAKEEQKVRMIRGAQNPGGPVTTPMGDGQDLGSRKIQIRGIEKNRGGVPDKPADNYQLRFELKNTGATDVKGLIWEFRPKAAPDDYQPKRYLCALQVKPKEKKLLEIRPATTLGVPDASVLLASFVLSHDNDPLTVSYESVATNLLLQPGSYFALFAPQGSDQGFLLSQATIPFNYLAGSIQMGVLNPLTSAASVSSQFGAVRILGETNVLIDGCDSGVPNTEVASGLTIADLVADCAEGATNQGQFVSCIAHVTNELKKNGIITGKQKSALQTCAAQADSP